MYLCQTEYLLNWFSQCTLTSPFLYWGADNSLTRPERKQATATEDFDVHISYL